MSDSSNNGQRKRRPKQSQTVERRREAAARRPTEGTSNAEEVASGSGSEGPSSERHESPSKNMEGEKGGTDPTKGTLAKAKGAELVPRSPREKAQNQCRCVPTKDKRHTEEGRASPSGRWAQPDC